MSGQFKPSLKALQSFEAAARLESLTLAARELNVSVSAIAFQVRQVEEGLGRKLLGRNGRGLVATSEGRALAEELGAAFAQVASSLARYRAADANVVTVSMLPSFASLWLLPRLGAFRAGHSEVEVRILTSERRVNLEAEQVDCAIRCGEGRWPGLKARLLFPQQLAPLCSPGLDAARTGRGIGAAREEELIVNSRHKDEWRDWFRGVDMDAADPVRGQRLEGRELIAEAVLAGLGIGLMDVSIFARQVAAGELVQLGPAVHTGWNHYFVEPEAASLKPSVEAFRSWLFSLA